MAQKRCRHTYFISSSMALRSVFGLWPSQPFPSQPRLQLRIRNKSKFYMVGLSAPRPTPNLEDQGIPFCLSHHFDLCDMGAPASSYPTNGIALRIL
jgi:hypothetical protein